MVRGSPKIYPKVRGARPEDVKSGLTLEHVGSDGVVEASKTYTKLAGARGSMTIPAVASEWFLRLMLNCPTGSDVSTRRIFVVLIKGIDFKGDLV